MNAIATTKPKRKNTSAKLKSCPFCGRQPRIRNAGFPGLVNVGCINKRCAVSAVTAVGSLAWAVARWNTRKVKP